LVVAAMLATSIHAQQAQPKARPEITRAEEAIHQEVTIKAGRSRVYNALTDEKQFDGVVKLSAANQAMHLAAGGSRISREVGGAFSLFGGQILGRQVELVPNE